MAKAILPLDELQNASYSADTHIWQGSGYYWKFEGGGVRGFIDNAHNCGNATYRWALVRGVTITSGDLGFEEDSCLKCNKKFNPGDDIILKVKALSHWGGTLMIPIHLRCASESKVKRIITIPKFELKHAFANGKHIVEQHPVTIIKKVKMLQIKKLDDFEIAHLDEKTGVWQRVQIGQQIPDFIIGEVLPELDALEEVEIEKEEIVYVEKEIEI